MPHKTEVPGQIGEMRAIEFFFKVWLGGRRAGVAVVVL